MGQTDNLCFRLCVAFFLVGRGSGEKNAVKNEVKDGDYFFFEKIGFFSQGFFISFFLLS